MTSPLTRSGSDPRRRTQAGTSAASRRHSPSAPPPIVRRTHERDRQQGLAPEQSGVYALFKGSYFMAELPGSAIAGAPGGSRTGRHRCARGSGRFGSVARGRIGKCDGDGRCRGAPAAGSGAARLGEISSSCAGVMRGLAPSSHSRSTSLSQELSICAVHPRARLRGGRCGSTISRPRSTASVSTPPRWSPRIH